MALRKKKALIQPASQAPRSPPTPAHTDKHPDGTRLIQREPAVYRQLLYPRVLPQHQRHQPLSAVALQVGQPAPCPRSSAARMRANSASVLSASAMARTAQRVRCVPSGRASINEDHFAFAIDLPGGPVSRAEARCGAEDAFGPTTHQDSPALSSPNILSSEPGTWRKATFMRFQPLMAATRQVSSDNSSSGNCSRASA